MMDAATRACCALVTLFCLLCAPPLHAAERVTSPARNGGSGQIPSGFERVVFNTADGDWVADIRLPTAPRQGDVVEIHSAASYVSQVAAQATLFGVKQIALARGTTLRFTWNSRLGRWVPGGRIEVTPGPDYRLPAQTQKLGYLYLDDGHHAPRIGLPGNAPDGALLAVQSMAAATAQILPDRVVYPATLQLHQGDTYVFRFHKALDRWLLVNAPERAQSAAAALQVPTSPRTRVDLRDGQWQATQTLPATAGDRDRFVLRSTASLPATITAERFARPAPVELAGGDEYEFMYTAATRTWHMTRHPTRRVALSALADGRLATASVPVTRVVASQGDTSPQLALPAAQEGARVVFNAPGDRSVTVVATGLSERVGASEEVAFVVGADGRWHRETRTIDILSLYSKASAGRLGASAARARLVQAMALTNEALENSGANFRYRMVGLRQYDAAPGWKKLNDVVAALRDAPLAQQWRNELKADGIYYEGTESGCGLAWVRASAFNMVATGSLNCGITVMRHELGHNLGLSHGGGPVPNIMAGNAQPYYGTPLRFSAEGLPMRNAGEVDGVAVMNAFSAAVAGYR